MTDPFSVLKSGASSLDRRHEFDYILMSGLSAWRRRNMHRYLWEDPKWRLVYAGADGFVYVRNIDRFMKLEGLKTHPLIEQMKRVGMEEGNLKY